MRVFVTALGCGLSGGARRWLPCWAHVFQKEAGLGPQLFDSLLDSVGVLDCVIELCAELLDAANALGMMAHASPS